MSLLPVCGREKADTIYNGAQHSWDWASQVRDREGAERHPSGRKFWEVAPSHDFEAHSSQNDPCISKLKGAQDVIPLERASWHSRT